MTQAGVAGAGWLEDLSPDERIRLVRLCAYLTGQNEAAEDLAQETLYEACRNAHRLDDPAARSRWLAAIARNVCLRWMRRSSRELGRRARYVRDAPDGAAISEDLADDIDIELDLEREELAALLDRTLALLPPPTRTVLILRYIRESPLREIAAQLGLSEDAVAKRMERGRLTLRRLLTTAFAEDAVAFGLPGAGSTAEWRETRTWCLECGTSHLLMRLPAPPGTISFRCASCHPAPDVNAANYLLANRFFAQLLGGLTQPGAILRRTAQWSHAYFRRALDEGAALCTHCGRPARLRVAPLEDMVSPFAGAPWVLVSCDACGHEVSSSLGGLVASLPEVQRFWRAHRRIRTIAWSEAEVDGRAAVIARLESVTSAAGLDVVSAHDSLQVLGIHGTLPTARDR